MGYESCNNGNYSTRTCNCGYAYTYYKPHNIDYTKISATNPTWKVHYYICKGCGAGIDEKCEHNGKNISCINPGTCDKCGTNYETDMGHDLTGSGKCKTCGKQFFSILSSKFNYTDDCKGGTFEVKIKFNYDYVDFSRIYWYSFDSIGDPQPEGYTLDTDGKTRIYKWNVTFNKFTKSSWYYLCMNVKINNGYSQSEGGAGFTLTGDHTAPIISDIVQTSQTSANGWATIKQLTVSGTEASAGVKITIKDKATGEVFLNNAYATTTDGKYSYSSTLPLEGDENGRTYVCSVTDVNGNTSTKEFVVSKTDGSYPQLKSGTQLKYTDWTNAAKNISLSFFDFGAGGVEASLDNQIDYKALTKSGEYYVWNHLFGNQTGTTEHTIYVRDALGNAGSYKFTVGNTDNTAYSISYNLNGGSLIGQKTSYTVADSFTLPTPTKTGYTFTGWTGNNGVTPQKTVTVNKGTRGNLNYTANWQINTYIIDANGILNEKDGGNVAGYATIDVYINGKLDAENVIDYCKSQPYGTKYEIRYKANDGYVFVAGGNNGIYSGTTTNDVSFYPVFKTKVLTTTFHRNRNSSDTVTATQKYTYGIDGQTFSDNNFDYPRYRLVGYDLNKNAENPIWSVNNGVAQYWIDEQYPANDVYAIWKPISWTTKYDANGGSGTMADTMHRFNGGDKIRHNQFTRPGWIMTGWTVSRVRDGVTEWLYGASDGDWIDGDSWYELGKNPSGTNLWVEHNLDAIDISSTYIDGDVHIMHAQWRYIPISVKVPQILTGDHTGKSQFRVKCDDMKAGNIKVSVPSSFIYKQTGKADVTATITSKSGSGVITPANKVCVYYITTKSGLSAGCWQGSFNIGLTLTKE